jgi:hypothetical protein
MPPEEPTVSVKLVVCVAEVPVPVIVMVEVPDGVLDEVATVSVEEEPAVTEAGLKDADAPVGRPEALSDTVCALPEVTAVEIVEVADPPGLTEAEAGFAAIEKSFVVEVGVRTTSSYLVYVASPG